MVDVIRSACTTLVVTRSAQVERLRLVVPREFDEHLAPKMYL